MHRACDERVGPLLDEVTAFLQRNTHVIRHRAHGWGEESGDEGHRPADAAYAGRLTGRACEAGVENGGDVVRVLDPPGFH